ncbi:MAG: hypothetical protein CSA33_00930 [Desulfobulbus propionicus]|nr:MAG: hypothetical protein CSA33_00930 [Desulfobulbus propionicus]
MQAPETAAGCYPDQKGEAKPVRGPAYVPVDAYPEEGSRRLFLLTNTAFSNKTSTVLKLLLAAYSYSIPWREAPLNVCQVYAVARPLHRSRAVLFAPPCNH